MLVTCMQKVEMFYVTHLTVEVNNSVNAKMEVEGLRDLVTCMTPGRQRVDIRAGIVPIVETHKLYVDLSRVYPTMSCIDTVF